MARTGVDEFYETIRLLIAKHFWEATDRKSPLAHKSAQELLIANASVVERFVEGETYLCAPAEVADECLRILAPTELSSTSYGALHTVFEQMTGKHYKADKGQYFTPPHVVDFCISVLRPRKGELICDPACGSGAFLKSAFDEMNSDVVSNTIFGFDISKRAAKTASLLSYLACDDKVVTGQMDTLSVEPKSLLEVDGFSVEEYMRRHVQNFGGFDVIATNPPFAGDVSDANFLDYYQTARFGAAKVERDTLFIERCKMLLKPGGRLAIVLPDNKFSGTKFADLRRWIAANMRVVGIVSLHSYTFRPFTSQKACVLFAENLPKGTGVNSIHMYRSDMAGKSSNGEPVLLDGVINHDLDDIKDDLIKEWKIG